MNRGKIVLVLSALASLATLAACTSNDASPSSCGPNKSLLAAIRACRSDDQCACGAHCSLGVCTSDCGVGANGTTCPSGARCDSFGRCRAPGDDRAVAPVSSLPQGDIHVESAVVSFPAKGEGTIRFRAGSSALGPMRVAASAGYEIRCAPDGQWGGECRDAGLALGAERAIGVRATPSATALGHVDIFAGGRTESVTVGQDPQLPATPLEPGAYAGTATLVSVAIPNAAFPSAPASTPGVRATSVSVPVTAQIFTAGSGGTIAVTDPFHALNTAGQWIGTLASNGASTGTVAFPRAIVEAGTLTSTIKTEVLGTVTATYAAAPSGAAITVTMNVEYGGFVAGTRLPRAVWQLALVHAGDLPAGASVPSVPPDATPTLPAGAATTPTDWSNAAATLFQGITVGSAEPIPTQVLATLQATSGTASTTRRFDACTSGGRLLGAVVSTRDEWRNGSVQPSTPVAPQSLAHGDIAGKNALLGEILSPVQGAYVRSASVANVTTNAPAGTIPCAYAFDPALLYCYDGTASSSVLQLPALDRCAEIAAEMKCVVHDVNVAMGIAFDAHLDTTTSLTSAPCANRSNPVTGSITKVCTLPTYAWNCGELAMCVGADGYTSSSPSAVPLAIGGDLPCGAGTRTLAPIAEQNRNDSANTDTVTMVVENVLSDFARLQQAAAAPFPAAKGFDAPRALVALEYATEIDRQRAADKTVPPSAGATRFAARLLQQWASAAALIANEAGQRARVPESVQGAMPDPQFPSARDALARSLDAWNIVLHPRFATALSAMDGATLAAPDYRSDWMTTPAADPNYAQQDGLPIALFDALGAQLALLDVVLYKASLASDASALPIAGRAIRIAVLVQSLARDLYARIVAATPTLPWADRFAKSDAAFASKLAQAIARAALLQQGRNPLGIEDEDLPLYFSGASVDPAARFSAISDYLLGNGTTATMAWAPQAVAQAQTAADALSTAYKEQVTRQYQGALASVDAKNRQDQIRINYGAQVVSYCGIPSGLQTVDVLEKWTPFDPNTCFWASDLPQCRVDMSAVNALLDEPTVLSDMCVARTLASAIPSVEFKNASINDALKATLLDGQISCTYNIGNCAHPSSLDDKCLKCGNAVSDPVTLAGLATLDLSHVAGDQLLAAQAACRAQYPGARAQLPGPDDTGASVFAHPECYRGSIGDLAFSLRGAAKDLEIARSSFADHLDAYDIEMRTCYIKVASNQKLDELRAGHDAKMQSLRDSKSEADKGVAIANGVFNCAEAAVGAASAGVGAQMVVAGAAAAVACGAAIAVAVEQVRSIDLQKQMDDTEAEYQSEITQVQENTDVKICMNEAHQQLVGMRTASQQIERALIDFAHASSDLQGAIGSAQQAYDEGRTQLAVAQGRAVRPPALDAWVDARVDAYVAAMSKARRTAYLAERAVEYEYQASLAARAQILTADTPAQLAQALSDLRNTSGTLGINGHRPSQLKVVLSLRDHLLQLWDTSHVAQGEQQLSPSDRFKLLLQDPQYALFANGVYAGQRIPLQIVPLGALHGDTKGIEVFATTDCAERIWSVNASILGSGTLVRGQATTFTRMDLLKSNTFYSQLCSAPSGGNPFQIASVRPSRNLFKDPSFGLAGPMTSGASMDPSVPNEVTLDSRARIQAYFNVPRDKFEEDAYANGETSELAARGLYGEYALFFPAGILSVAQRDAQGNVTGYSDGLDLGAVDDILLRIDYVSVAR